MLYIPNSKIQNLYNFNCLKYFIIWQFQKKENQKQKNEII